MFSSSATRGRKLSTLSSWKEETSRMATSRGSPTSVEGGHARGCRPLGRAARRRAASLRSGARRSTCRWCRSRRRSAPASARKRARCRPSSLARAPVPAGGGDAGLGTTRSKSSSAGKGRPRRSSMSERQRHRAPDRFRPAARPRPSTRAPRSAQKRAAERPDMPRPSTSTLLSCEHAQSTLISCRLPVHFGTRLVFFVRSCCISAASATRAPPGPG